VNEPNHAGREEENVDFSVCRVESDNELEFGMELESGNELERKGGEMCIVLVLVVKSLMEERKWLLKLNV